MNLQVSAVVILCVWSGNISAANYLYITKDLRKNPPLGNGKWKMWAGMLVPQQETPFAACQMHLAESLFPSVTSFHNVLKYIPWQAFRCFVVCWMISAFSIQSFSWMKFYWALLKARALRFFSENMSTAASAFAVCVSSCD